MTAKQIMTQMHSTIHDLLPHLHGHQLKALSALCYGLAAAKHCHLSRVALAVPNERAQPQSTQRRLSRFVANERVVPLRCALSYSRRLLSRWQGRRVVWLLDETTLVQRFARAQGEPVLSGTRPASGVVLLCAGGSSGFAAAPGF